MIYNVSTNTHKLFKPLSKKSIAIDHIVENKIRIALDSYME